MLFMGSVELIFHKYPDNITRFLSESDKIKLRNIISRDYSGQSYIISRILRNKVTNPIPGSLEIKLHDTLSLGFSEIKLHDQYFRNIGSKVW